MHFHVITLFPEVCRTYTDASVIGRAQKDEKGKGAKVKGKRIDISYYNPREFSDLRHQKVDLKPYGGGPGMVMAAEPILKAYESAIGRKKAGVRTLIMSPRGRVFDRAFAQELARDVKHLVLISGRYEGIDARVGAALGAEDVSVGDYTLTGGELPALSIIDAVSRYVPGVLGDIESIEDTRATKGEVYTRPEVLVYKKKKYTVPEVLLSGHAARIEKWRSGEGGDAV